MGTGLGLVCRDNSNTGILGSFAEVSGYSRVIAKDCSGNSTSVLKVGTKVRAGGGKSDCGIFKGRTKITSGEVSCSSVSRACVMIVTKKHKAAF